MKKRIAGMPGTMVPVLMGCGGSVFAGTLAGLAIGLTLVLVHIVCIPVTGISVNSARSIGPALFEGGETVRKLEPFPPDPIRLNSPLAGCTNRRGGIPF